MTTDTIQETFKVLNQLQQICFIIDGDGQLKNTSNCFEQLLSEEYVEGFSTTSRYGLVRSTFQESFVKQWRHFSLLKGEEICSNVNSFDMTLPFNSTRKLKAYIHPIQERGIHSNNTCYLVLIQPSEQTDKSSDTAVAHLDCLTGLSTRWKLYAIEEKLAQLRYLNDNSSVCINTNHKISQKKKLVSYQNKMTVTVAFFDLNDLKRVNDIFGHAVGDAYLRIFADLLSYYARSEDSLVRYGGDEFVGVYFGMTKKVLKKRIEVIQQNLTKEFNAFLIKQHGNNTKMNISKDITNSKLQMGFAYGIQQLEQGQTLKTAISLADSKMYVMKNLMKSKLSEQK